MIFRHWSRALHQILFLLLGEEIINQPRVTRNEEWSYFVIAYQGTSVLLMSTKACNIMHQPIPLLRGSVHSPRRHMSLSRLIRLAASTAVEELLNPHSTLHNWFSASWVRPLALRSLLSRVKHRRTHWLIIWDTLPKTYSSPSRLHRALCSSIHMHESNETEIDH